MYLAVVIAKTAADKLPGLTEPWKVPRLNDGSRLVLVYKI